MRESILLIAAATAALSVAACNRPDGGSEKEKNETEEAGNRSSQDEGRERRGGSEGGEEEGGDTGTREEGGEEAESGSREGGGEEFGSNLRRGGRGGGGDEAELRDALQQAAREQQARLPLRDGITTVYAVEAEGTEFIVSLRISEDFSDEQFERLEQAFQRNSCNGDSAELIRLGATTTYRVTDSEGERRSFSFDSC